MDASGESLDELLAGPWEGPAVGLLDLDAFFASVEQLDHPEWRGKPVVVGGSAERRGVVSTASYEARRYGIRSAMPSAQAKRLCPDAIWTQGNYARYSEMSACVMAILADETPYVEQVSIDEAFFDITPGRYSREHPASICRRIQERVAELGITCSIGLSTSKTVAKIASEHEKPRGLTIVPPGSEAAFMAPLPVAAMSGIGPASASSLAKLGIKTLGELAAVEPDSLEAKMGVIGPRLVLRARGLERSPVAPIDAPDEAKSVSNERTFAQDLESAEDVVSGLHHVCSLVARRLRKHGLAGTLVTLKVRTDFLHTRTAQMRTKFPVDEEHAIFETARVLLDELWQEGQPVRLIGVGVSRFTDDQEAPDIFGEAQARKEQAERRKSLARAADALRERFGTDAVLYGSDLRFKEGVSDTQPTGRNQNL